jgi:hypothetical protein
MSITWREVFSGDKPFRLPTREGKRWRMASVSPHGGIFVGIDTFEESQRPDDQVFLVTEFREDPAAQVFLWRISQERFIQVGDEIVNQENLRAVTEVLLMGIDISSSLWGGDWLPLLEEIQKRPQKALRMSAGPGQGGFALSFQEAEEKTRPIERAEKPRNVFRELLFNQDFIEKVVEGVRLGATWDEEFPSMHPLMRPVSEGEDPSLDYARFGMGSVLLTDVLWRVSDALFDELSKQEISEELLLQHGLHLPFQGMEIEIPQLLKEGFHLSLARGRLNILHEGAFIPDFRSLVLVISTKDGGAIGARFPYGRMSLEDIGEEAVEGSIHLKFVVNFLLALNCGFLEEKRISVPKAKTERAARRAFQRGKKVKPWTQVTLSPGYKTDLPKKIREARQALREAWWRGHTRTYWVKEDNVGGRVILARKQGKHGWLCKVAKRIKEKLPESGHVYKTGR